jgi:hypothetical protein
MGDKQLAHQLWPLQLKAGERIQARATDHDHASTPPTMVTISNHDQRVPVEPRAGVRGVMPGRTHLKLERRNTKPQVREPTFYKGGNYVGGSPAAGQPCELFWPPVATPIMHRIITDCHILDVRCECSGSRSALYRRPPR